MKGFLCSIPLLLLLLSYDATAQSRKIISHQIECYFQTNKHLPDITELTRLSNKVKEVRGLNIRSIEITGYCDDIGSKAYNHGLALRRVRATVKVLQSLGIDSFKIAQKTAHGSQPLDSHCLYASIYQQRELNRKTAIKIWALSSKGKPGQKSPILITHHLLTQPRRVDYPVEKAVLQPSRIGDILFVPNTTDLLPECQFALNYLLKVMQAYPNCHAKIEGHIFSPGAYGDALDKRTGMFDLSFARAKRVSNFLTSNGIDASRVTYIGLANYVPTNLGAKYDRRVEVKLTYPDNLALQH